MQERLGLQRRESRAPGEQASQQSTDVRGGKTAASHFLSSSACPRNFNILSTRGKFDELAKPAEKVLRIRAVGEAYRRHTRKMPGPFAFQKILVIA